MNDLKGVVVGVGATPWQMDLRGPQPSKWDEKKEEKIIIQTIWLFCRWEKKLTIKVSFPPLPGDQKRRPDHFLAPNSTKLQREKIGIQIKAFNQLVLRCNHCLLSLRSNGVCARKAPALMLGSPGKYNKPILVLNYYICILEIMRNSIFAHIISLLWHCKSLLSPHPLQGTIFLFTQPRSSNPHTRVLHPSEIKISVLTPFVD